MKKTQTKHYLVKVRWDEAPREIPRKLHVVVNIPVGTEESDIEESLSEALSDSYGFCHKGFTYDEVPGFILTIE